MVSFIRKHWGTIAGTLGPLIVYLVPTFHAYAIANPKSTISVIVLALVTLFNSRAPKNANGA